MRTFNKMFPKFISVLAAVCITAASSPAFAAQYIDVSTHWAEAVIEKWSEKGVIQGYDGLFHPDEHITRGDMAVILCRATEFEDTAENTFSDLDSSEYYAESVLKLAKAGVMAGYGGYVRPLDPITREEAFALFVRLYKLSATGGELAFSDAGEISEWAAESVQVLCALEIVKGSDNKINPKSNITRAEVVQILENISQHTEGISSQEQNAAQNTNSENSTNEENKTQTVIGGGSSGGGGGGGSSSRPSGGGSSGGGGSSSGGNTGTTTVTPTEEPEIIDTPDVSDVPEGDESQLIEDEKDSVVGEDDLETGGLW